MTASDLLPFRPRPEPGELLTSWLGRLALENATTVARIIASCTPDTHYPVLDLDHNLPKPLLHRLADRTGLPWTAIERTTLHHLHTLYVGQRVPHGGSRWFMSVQPVRQRFTRHGLQCCPDCLASDAVPYFRQIWRLSFVTTCPVHGCLLLDRCPACGAPVDPRGACDGQVGLFDHTAICLCATCGSDFRSFAWTSLGSEVTIRERREAWGHRTVPEGQRETRIAQETVFNIVMNWQTALTEPQEGRWVSVGGGLVSVREYLRGCRHLLRLLCFDDLGETFSRAVSLYSGRARPPLSAPPGRLRFERSEVGVRHDNLLMLTWLLSDWPISFYRVCIETEISYTALVDPKSTMPLPVWYEQQCLAVRMILSNRPGRRSRAATTAT